MESIEIKDRAAAQLSRGVSWIFSNEIYKRPVNLKPGTWCTFHCRSKIIATGYANPHSLIFGRAVALGAREDITELLRERLQDAFAQRLLLKADGAARLVFSEGDFIPGLVIDVYGDFAVLQSNTAGIDTVLPELEQLVPEIYEATTGRPLKGFIVKADSAVRELEHIKEFKTIVSGAEKDFESVSFVEGRARFAANLIDGQKTGFFLDQKDNRNYLAGLINGAGQRVLDLCCYSGGWGLRALVNGAEHVTFVDDSAPALKLVKRGLELNTLDSARASLVDSDVFEFLEKDTNMYDIVVADPPAFVKSKKHLVTGMKAYEKLNRLAWQRLRPGGILITCSCSYHLSDADFLDIVKTAVAKEKGIARVAFRGGQAADHPVLLAMPETRYLKCLGLQKI